MKSFKGLIGQFPALQNGLTAEQMGNKMISMIDYLFNAKPIARKRYTLTPVTETKYEQIGIVE